MIHYIRGLVADLRPTQVILETGGGIGYLLGVSLQTSGRLTQGETVLLHTQPVIREDAHLLFGFYHPQEREMFNHLISVSGIGASSAMMMLSSLSLEEIAEAIVQSNSAVLTRVKGIGLKTSERVIVELRDKMQKFLSQQGAGADAVQRGYTKTKDEALMALEVLGIARKVAEKLADRLLKSHPDMGVEDLVKMILKNL